jgi:hypothetical protein
MLRTFNQRLVRASVELENGTGLAMDNSEATIYFTKIAAAKRQLDTAIRMYFVHEDKLSIHTLVAAAFRVLRDLIKKRGANYAEELLRAGYYEIAKKYGAGPLSGDVSKALKEIGLLQLVETIAADDEFEPSRIRIIDLKEAEKRAWSSDPANFLKHADHDPDALLAASEVDNEMFLIHACTAYLELIPTSSPEIMAFIALWAVEHEDAAPDVHEPARKLADRLASLKKDERFHACAEWVRQMKN